MDRILEIVEITEEDGVQWKCNNCGYVHVHPISHEPDNKCPNDGLFMKKGKLVRGYAKTRSAPKLVRM